MIRFVDLGDQLTTGVAPDNDHSFAFWDTVTDCFVEFTGCYVFDSLRDFNETASTDEYSPELIERCRRKITEKFRL